MIEHDDMSTLPRPVESKTADVPAAPSVPEAPATIQVPAPSTPAAPSANPYMSVDDLLALRIADDPQISPDGSLIAFSIQQSHAETNTTGSAIWVVNSRGRKTQSSRQLTNIAGTYHDVLPRWSPDGQTLAFLSDRSGSLQIHL